MVIIPLHLMTSDEATTLHSTTINVPQFGTCEAKDNGVPCQHPASVTIIVNAGCWRGFPAEERRICLYHNAMLCRGQPQEQEVVA